MWSLAGQTPKPQTAISPADTVCCISFGSSGSGDGLLLSRAGGGLRHWWWMGIGISFRPIGFIGHWCHTAGMLSLWLHDPGV